MVNKPDQSEESMNRSFATAMVVATWVGIAVMLLPGIAYISGFRPSVTGEVCAAGWHLPADRYWEETTRQKKSGYGWFLRDLGKTEHLTLLGVAILALAPLLSLIAATRYANTRYRVLFLILMAEFIFTIFRPLFMDGGGH